MHEATNGCLFVEGLRMRPTAFRVLNALFVLGRNPTWFQDGSTIAEIAATANLSEHVVRARLQDLRRLEACRSLDWALRTRCHRLQCLLQIASILIAFGCYEQVLEPDHLEPIRLVAFAGKRIQQLV